MAKLSDPLENPRPIVQYLRQCGAFVINLHGDAYLIGLPDVIACLEGRFIAIEVKRPKGRARKLQLAILKKIQLAGGIAIVASTVEDVRQVLNDTRSTS